MVVTPDFYLQVMYICSLKVTHGGKTPDFCIYGKKKSLKVTHGGKTPDIYIYMFSQGHSWWQNYRPL